MTFTYFTIALFIIAIKEKSESPYVQQHEHVKKWVLPP